MNRSKFAAVFAALLTCSALGAATGDPADSAQAQAKLAAVRARIAALTARLGADLKQRDALHARVRETEISITATRRRLETLRAAQSAAEKRRLELRAQQAREQNALDGERAALAAQVRAAYMIGREEKLKLLLNQNDPAAAGRVVYYYGYFARQRGAKIGLIREQVQHLQDVVAQLDATTVQLKGMQDDSALQMKELTQARSDRGAALAAVSEQLVAGNAQLAQLQREAQAVEALIADLSRVLQDFPVDSQQSFESLRGRLAWPVSGKMTTRYQEARGAPGNPSGQAAVRWNGVMIETSRGAKVRSPFFGRVVYADWLQGLGLLLIVAHSGNYMTLYGHAEVLYKSVGDWVSPGDVIAALPDAGAPPQLYFEIRDGRKTVDPKLWLKASP